LRIDVGSDIAMLDDRNVVGVDIPGVLKRVELDADAVGDSRITDPSTGAADARANWLDHEDKTVGRVDAPGICDSELEECAETV
jgi:hypothetical protein